MVKFAGKTIVVTGSGKQKGLGQGILQAFADDGANCVVSDLAIDAEAEVQVKRHGRNRKLNVAADEFAAIGTSTTRVIRVKRPEGDDGDHEVVVRVEVVFNRCSVSNNAASVRNRVNAYRQ